MTDSAERSPADRHGVRIPSGPPGPLRSTAHLAVASGRLPTLTDLRDRFHRSDTRPRARALRVFSVEPTAIQLDWAALGPGPVQVRAADTTIRLATDGGPGTVVIDGLTPARSVEIRLSGEGVPGDGITLTARTSAPPPGEEIARIATISDLHIGETTFGFLNTISEHDSGRPGHPERCAQVAIADAAAWGASRLVVKGDLVDQSHPGNWAIAIELLESAGMPVHVVPGNHEVKRRRTIEAVDALAGTAIEFTGDVSVVDLDGAHVVLVNSTRPGEERGSLTRVHDPLLSLLGDLPDADGALVAMHHHLLHSRSPSGWPVGIPIPEVDRTLDAIGRTHRRTMITSGHVHRNRLWGRGPLTMTCVGSVKDYPGVWAGYVFHEGGIRQVVRRVGGVDALTWTERTGDALGGAYRHWTPGRLDKRCVTITWT